MTSWLASRNAEGDDEQDGNHAERGFKLALAGRSASGGIDGRIKAVTRGDVDDEGDRKKNDEADNLNSVYGPLLVTCGFPGKHK